MGMARVLTGVNPIYKAIRSAAIDPANKAVGAIYLAEVDGLKDPSTGRRISPGPVSSHSLYRAAIPSGVAM
jgi:hypothetical protein